MFVRQSSVRFVASASPSSPLGASDRCGYPPALSRMCWRCCCRPDFNPHDRHVSDGAHGGNQPAFRGPEICGVGTEEDAAERDLTPRTISNCLRHLEIKPSNRSLISSSFIKPLTVAGSPIRIN